MKIKLVLLLLVLIVISGCAKNISGGEPVKNITEKKVQLENSIDVSLRTQDSKLIKARFFPNSVSKKGVVLIHQFSLDKSSWDEWAKTFQKTHNVLAIDLRGHGESSDNYTEFEEKDFLAMKNDVKAAEAFLLRKGLTKDSISYVGASIGANTVQNFVAINEHAKSVLLSPGKIYKGIPLTMQDTSSLVIVSKEDTYSFESVKELEKISPNSTFVYLENRGHGTNMLDEELVEQIHNFLNE